jgi:hypothetical protein
MSSESNASAEALEVLAGRVREMSRAGSVVSLSEIWHGAESECLTALGEDGPIPDIAAIREGSRVFLYSSACMAQQYAAMAARAAAGDVIRLVAEAVRFDSSTYPRPTPASVLEHPPFLLDTAGIDAVIAQLSCDPEGDIRTIRASDGSLFLFSTRHLTPGHAASLAEWMAVGQFESP